jgi:hypothetical protein
MLFNLSILTTLFAAGVSALTLPTTYVKRSGTISVTPHDSFSSSIGVLGCKINTNRVAYWPSAPDCNNICVKVSANGRSVYLLKVDQSGGAYDISYGAWNWLMVGQSAPRNPQMGGGLTATYENVPAEQCAHLLYEPEQKLAFAAANSMNFISSCGPDTWVGRNHALYNIANSACTYGHDERCTMPPPSMGNQPSCQHTLGETVPLKTCPVYNFVYGTGKKALALQ